MIGKTVRLGDRSATIVGVLEPSVPYPTETEIIANVVTSPHHLDATMVDGRVHRMTELFARLAPGEHSRAARAELRTVHGAMVKEHPEAYPTNAELPDRGEAAAGPDRVVGADRPAGPAGGLGAGVRHCLLECRESDSGPLRSARRRAGGSRRAWRELRGALRRTLLAESLVLCGAGAILGVAIARPMVGGAGALCVSILGARAGPHRRRHVALGRRRAGAGRGRGSSRVRAAAADGRWGERDSACPSGNLRITTGTNRRLRLFAVTQIAASFVLLAGAGMLLTTLIALQCTRTGFDTANVLAHQRAGHLATTARREIAGFYREVMRRIGELPGVERVAVGTSCRGVTPAAFGRVQFSVEGYAKADGEEDPRARFRTVSPGFFATLGVPMVAGRDFNDADRRDAEQVVIVSQSWRERMFPARSRQPDA